MQTLECVSATVQYLVNSHDAAEDFRVEPNTSSDTVGSCALSSDVWNSSLRCVVMTTPTPSRSHCCLQAHEIICVTSIGESSSNRSLLGEKTQANEITTVCAVLTRTPASRC